MPLDACQKWFQALLFEYLVVGFEIFKESPQKSNPLNSLPCLQLYRGGNCAQIGRKIFRGQIYIDPNPCYDIVDFPLFGRELSQDSADLAVINQAVIGPFDE